jgi:hypothetical protein
MEVSKADHFKCLYITEIIHKSNCTIRTTQLWYYLHDESFIPRVCHDANQEMLRLSLLYFLCIDTEFEINHLEDRRILTLLFSIYTFLLTY